MTRSVSNISQIKKIMATFFFLGGGAHLNMRENKTEKVTKAKIKLQLLLKEGELNVVRVFISSLNIDAVNN